MTRTSLALILVATSLSTFLSTYLTGSVNMALKVIGAEYSANPAELSLLTSVYLLFTSLGLIPFGRMSDIHGPKRTLLCGCAFFVLSNFLVPWVSFSFASLVAFRGLQGIGAALLLVSNTPIITAVFPPERRATAIGYLSGMVFFGYSVGSYLGGLLIDLFGWRSIFTSAGIAGAISFFAIMFLVPSGHPKNEEDRAFDMTGTALYAAMLIFLQMGSACLTSPWGIVLLAGSILAFVLFVRGQWASAHPVCDVRLFAANRVFAMSNLAGLFTFTATYGTQYLLSLYLQCNRGLTPSAAGKIMLFQPLMQLFFSPLAGFIADRTSPALISSAGMGMIAAALILLANLAPQSPFAVIYLALILIGIGISFFSAPNTSIIMGSVAEGKRGMAAATNSLMRNLGMQLSFILCGSAFLISLGSVEGIPPEQYGPMLSTMKIVFAVFACLCVIGVFVSLMRARPKRAAAAGESCRENTGNTGELR
jgi:MFS family permease